MESNHKIIGYDESSEKSSTTKQDDPDENKYKKKKDPIYQDGEKISPHSSILNWIHWLNLNLGVVSLPNFGSMILLA